MKCSRNPAAAALLLSMSFAAVDATAQAAAPRTPCQSVWVTAPVVSGESPSPSSNPLEFSAAEVLDLEFRIVIPADASRAGRPLELKLFTPKGHLYQTLAIPAGASAPGRLTAPKRRAGHQTLTARLPVAGTTIVNNSLYGTWKAEAYFEGERTACAKPRTFVIKP